MCVLVRPTWWNKKIIDWYVCISSGQLEKKQTQQTRMRLSGLCKPRWHKTEIVLSLLHHALVTLPHSRPFASAPFYLEVTAIHQIVCFEFSIKCGQLSSGSLEGAHLLRLHRKLTDLLAGRGDRKPRSCFAEKWNRLFFRESFVWIDIKFRYILVHLSAFDKKWAAAGVEPLRDEVSNLEQLACAKLTLS